MKIGCRSENCNQDCLSILKIPPPPAALFHTYSKLGILLISLMLYTFFEMWTGALRNPRVPLRIYEERYRERNRREGGGEGGELGDGLEWGIGGGGVGVGGLGRWVAVGGARFVNGTTRHRGLIKILIEMEIMIRCTPMNSTYCPVRYRDFEWRNDDLSIPFKSIVLILSEPELLESWNLFADLMCPRG